jgi:hypothetical protein
VLQLTALTRRRAISQATLTPGDYKLVAQIGASAGAGTGTSAPGSDTGSIQVSCT